MEPRRATPELQTKIAQRRRRRADDARLVVSRGKGRLRCAWCNGFRNASSTLCTRCEPHKAGILRIMSLPKVEPDEMPATFARVNRQRRSARR
jgi:hypothetical protein